MRWLAFYCRCAFRKILPLFKQPLYTMSVSISMSERKLSPKTEAFKPAPSTLLFKEFSELSKTDVQELEQLISTECPEAPEAFCKDAFNGRRYQYIGMLRTGGQLAATCALRLDKLHTPFSKRKLPVIFAGLTFRSPNAQLVPMQDPFEAITTRFLRYKLGSAWPLKNTVHMAMTMNPRRIEKYHRRSNTVFPQLKGESNPEIGAFVQTYVWDQLDMDLPFVNDSLLSLDRDRVDITDSWHRSISNPKEEYNDFCFEQGIFKEEGDRIILTARRVVLCAHHTPSTHIKNIINRY